LESIVGAIAEELTRNSRVAAEEQCRHEAAIIQMARELGLDPRPAGHDDSAWMASCPQSRNHWMMISPERNQALLPGQLAEELMEIVIVLENE
jgi:hypothetical protein